jgi:Leucine-rich repeat (LRR) protein
MMTETPTEVPPLALPRHAVDLGTGDLADVDLDDSAGGFIQTVDDDDDDGDGADAFDAYGGGGGDGAADDDDDAAAFMLPNGMRLDAYISREKLVKLTGVADLSEVSHLEMRVDTGVNTLGDLGQLVPNLRQLKLSHSRIATVRDLGTTLTRLTVLWLGRVGLGELEGIGALPALAELYAPFNDVSDLSPLVACEHLECVDVEGNAVADLAQVHFLAAIPTLRALTLEGNPVTTVKGYRHSVVSLVPQLESLDDIDTGPEDLALPAADGGDGGNLQSGAGDKTAYPPAQQGDGDISDNEFAAQGPTPSSSSSSSSSYSLS